jgi:DNA-binding response OmpR family regulator
MSQLLVVEDDEEIGGQLVAALAAQGHTATLAKTAAEAEAAATSGGAAFDLVLLDLGLPDMDGSVLCRRLRQEVPGAVIVILTARSDEADVVLGLDAGADDYLTKPFRLLELLARIRAHLRRRTPVAGSQQTVGEMMLDPGARRVTVRGVELQLRPKEFDLLSVLASNAGQAVSRERLMAEVWDENWFGSTKTLDMHVSFLRRKLADAGEDPERISTLRGFGYRYENA